jgi:hypothetical protein
MKKLIILFSIMMCTSFLSHGQCTQPYKTLSAFNNDTVAFLNYNFESRRDCYIGKTLADVVADLQIPVQSYMTLPDDTYINIYSGVSIHIYPYNKVLYIEKTNRNQTGVYVLWETPLKTELLDAIGKQYGLVWTTAIYELVKDLKIKDIGATR